MKTNRSQKSITTPLLAAPKRSDGGLRQSDVTAVAFTLIEMLVVISVIAILAAMLFPAFSAIKKKMTIRKVKTELKAVVLAIDSYKSKKGYYPPDHVLAAPPGGVDPIVNSLYFELSGVSNTVAGFQTFDGATTLTVADCQARFGQGGILNCSKETTEDGGQRATEFIKQMKPNQYFEIAAGVRVLTCSVAWPVDKGQIIATVDFANPWRYVSSGPTNNPDSYDLWVDIVVGDKTNRISNWTETPEIVP
jgi:prepilin-type N-terminal cleavage/methylation domain-containing protein